MAKSRKNPRTKGRKKKTKQPAEKAKQPFYKKLVSGVKSRSPFLVFLLGFGSIMVVFYLVYSTNFYLEYIYQPVIKMDAWLGSKMLNLLGQNTQVQEADITSSSFAISINLGCDGLEAIALYLAAILAYPISFSLKIRGIMLGLVFLFLLNLVRIVSLFLVGNYVPDWFDFMHLELWQALFLIFTMAAWLVWIRWALAQKKKQYA